MKPASREFLETVFRAAVAAVDPAHLVRAALSADVHGLSLRCGPASASVRWREVENVYLVGGGKAGRAMGEAALDLFVEHVTGGVLSAARGQGGAIATVRFIEAGHPLPDDGSLAAAWEMLSLLSEAREKDLVISLVSGGGSAMISAPVEGVTPGEKGEVSRLLLRAGADIASFNAVRKHLSRVKGGWMARAAAPARVWALLLSDVPGDDPSVIASGPFSPDPTTYADALAVLARLGVLEDAPAAARERLAAGAAGKVSETPKPGDPAFAGVTAAIVGSNRTALDAAAAAARKAGAADVRVLPGFLEGEACDCARAFVSEMFRIGAALPQGRTAVLVAGGETTVHVRGTGTGGRSQEFTLAAALALSGTRGMAVLCGGTDGVDGPTDAAGAFADGTTCARAAAMGLSAAAHLANNDAYPFFRALSDLVVTGPTGTNVSDLAVGLVYPNHDRIAIP